LSTNNVLTRSSLRSLLVSVVHELHEFTLTALALDEVNKKLVLIRVIRGQPFA
jgi:hypothetical protein